MTTTLFACAAGTIVLPDRSLVLVDRNDGGNLPHAVELLRSRYGIGLQ